MEKRIRISTAIKTGYYFNDLVMDEMDGVEATRAIIQEWPEAKIVVVTSF